MSSQATLYLPAEDVPEDVLPISALADDPEVSVPKSTIYWWINRGLLVAFRIRGVRHVSKSALIAVRDRAEVVVPKHLANLSPEDAETARSWARAQAGASSKGGAK